MQTDSVQSNGVPPEHAAPKNRAAGWILFWLGVAGVSAVVSIFVIRTVSQRPASDPTTQRIEALIDEANRLLKALEEKS
ncbi:MAG: hypothetical protein JO101_12530 [Candidatus Eremiobacteraeota bacterium]|nr:hypothetical protein [Candidatus Eremiobacteraeota bacterium]